MFTQRHYEALAKLVGEVNWEESIDDFGKTNTGREHLIEDLIDMFEADNPKFNRWTFVSAIGKAQGLSQEDVDYLCQYCGRLDGH